MLQLNRVNKSYQNTHIIKDVSFHLKNDETIVILGPSGCGKTTLLNLISGMEKPDKGGIEVDGKPVAKPSTEISFILQDYGLLPWKTVLDNVALGLKIKGIKAKERLNIAQSQLHNLGLQGREHDYPLSLSGGERQRVAIARAYATSPRLMLMDEPFSSLDAITRETLQDTLVESWKSTPIPYLLVTHSVEEAICLGKRILIMSGSPAQLVTEFENPGFAQKDHRQSQDFYQLLRMIRSRLGEFW